MAAYKKNDDCQTHPNIWCWTDYKCPYSTTPWVGVTGVYAPLNNVCDWPGGATGTSPPANCPCVWANGTASNVCTINGRSPQIFNGDIQANVPGPLQGPLPGPLQGPR